MPGSPAYPRILFMGMTGTFSHTVLNELLDRNIPVSTCIFPVSNNLNRERELSVSHERPWCLETLAAENGIPNHGISRFDEKTVARIRELEPDIILVACFSLKIPESVTAVASVGSFNLHPSLLPDFRGPVPLFWQFRAGGNFGVTLHHLTQQYDAGNIVYQKPVQLDDGCSGEEANLEIARAGAELVQNMILKLGHGKPGDTPQDEEKASYQGWPSLSDFRIPIGWSARQAYNFIKGTSHWNQTYTIETGQETITTYNAVMYTVNKPVTESPSIRSVAFRHGYLLIKLP